MRHLYGVIGDPIAHSLSPLIHKGWMRDHNLPADYLALQVPSDEFDKALTVLSEKGFKGFNVTLPHKLNALQWAQSVTPRARKIGAVNTLWYDADGQRHGDNTDAPGFMASLSAIYNKPLEGEDVLVLGAGGAARAIIYALDEAGAKVALANRTILRPRRSFQNLIQAYIGRCLLKRGWPPQVRFALW
jgi:shikimate dehydrogenase